jgi:hypothetical protein
VLQLGRVLEPTWEPELREVEPPEPQPVLSRAKQPLVRAAPAHVGVADAGLMARRLEQLLLVLPELPPLEPRRAEQ